MERLTRGEMLESRFVNDRCVWFVQVVDRSHQHLSRRTYKSRIVDAHENDGAESSVGAFRAARPFVERDCPLHSGHAPNPIQVIIPQCVDLVAIKGLRIHYPNIGVHNVSDLTGRPRHDADENGDLIREKKRGESNGEGEAKILGPIGYQHLQRNEVHEMHLRKMTMIILSAKKKSSLTNGVEVKLFRVVRK